MADRDATIIPVEGETRIGGGAAPGIQGTLYAPTKGGAGLGSVFALDGVSSLGVTTTWYFFVTSAGVLRVSSTYPTNTESDGSAV
jgi:hypothetical protein